MTQEAEVRSCYNDYMIPVNNFAAPIIVRGEGSYVWDIDGKRYLDFTMGIGVCGLGHCHPRVVQAIAEQSAKLMHCSNVFCNENAPRLGREISEGSFHGKLFFCNSGGEANEGMLKAARLWGNTNGGRSEVICFKNSFHGRTLATTSATGQEIFWKGMEPLMPGFKFADFNDLSSVKAAITPQTCAILLEPVQGEGGLYPATPEFMTGLRELCNEHKLLLLFDEVQCGMGRTGKLFAYQHFGVEPDAMSMAKGIGNGFPLAGFEISDEMAKLFQPGITHGSTYGGNPLATAAGLAVQAAFKAERVLDNVNEISQYLQERIKALRSRHSCIKELRGLGLMMGIELGDVLQDAVKACREHGLLVLTAGKGVMRLMPSLLLTRQQADDAVAILDQALP